MQSKLVQLVFVIGITSISTSLFSERFFNVTDKKLKISVVDLKQHQEKKQFVLSPGSHKIFDLSQFKDLGVYISIKPVKSSFLLERKKDKAQLCELCHQAVELRCACEKRAKKEKKEHNAELEVVAKEMHGQNEFIIVESPDGLVVKLFGLKDSDEKE